MKTPYRITQAANHIWDAGVRWHAHGTVKRGTVHMFNFFQCDRITNDQVDTLRKYCPDMQVQGVSHKHAPEMTRVHLLFPKAAYYRSTQTIK